MSDEAREANERWGWRALALSLIVALVVGHFFHCSVSGSRSQETEEESAKAPAAVGGTASGGRSAEVEVRTPEAEPASGVGEAAPAGEPAGVGVSGVGGVVGAGSAKAEPEAEGPLAVECPSEGEGGVSFFFSPARPQAGKPLRVVIVSETELAAGGVAMISTGGQEKLSGVDSWGGPPYGWAVEVASAPEGEVRFALLAKGDAKRAYRCGTIALSRREPAPLGSLKAWAWPVERAWNREMENLYSAWVGRLFKVDVGAKAGWRPMHQVTRDPKRNLLYNYLGLDEDNDDLPVKVMLSPDCADTPFFLRTYFAWKLRLPFAARRCLRGNSRDGPSCGEELVTNMTTEWSKVNSVVERFNRFVGLTVSRTVHSGTVRTLPEDDASELYPVALSRESLRPGTVFADPNGHVLVVSRWVPGTEDRIGMLLAVDAHPDRTVSHKRFSPANFYFASHLRTGGFKAFRPAVFEGGKIRFMTNAELEASPDYGNRSLEQYEFESPEAFYRRMDKLLNPVPLDPVKAYASRMESLIELAEERVSAVQVGIDYMAANGWAEMEMPIGGEIFETIGPWEDYSTPARDLRFLLAVDEFHRFPRQVQDSPELFRIPEGKTLAAVRADLDAEWARLKGALGITYLRSDGSEWRLTLEDLLDRATAFEQAYNPNDCVEVRWGARIGSTEASTCTRRAPFEQRKRMEQYRVWHVERRRPAGF